MRLKETDITEGREVEKTQKINITERLKLNERETKYLRGSE